MAKSMETAALDVRKRQAWKTHMERRPGETVADWYARLAWSCYSCGRRFPPGQRQALNNHEDSHAGR
ncbi:hypothetical protein AB0L88_03455 [Saccharopolyspora shandongensis]|uniref:hypothetical protein n=1 Tax=Saccharopolyspora shandongensis TaxID=418495 RepID=UPI0034222727